jgi:competence protein ComEC
MTPSKILYLSSISFIGGVFCASFLSFKGIIMFAFGLALSSMLFFFQKGKGPSTGKGTALFILLLLLVFWGGVLKAEKAVSEARETNRLRGQPSYQKLLLPLKETLRARIYQNFSPPHSLLISALLLGDKKRISSAWKEKLNIAGVRHIVAISGMHIIILSSLLVWLLVFCGFSRTRAFPLVFFLIWFFILLTGAQTSSLRAGAMASIFLFGEKLGRAQSALRALALVAALMLFFNPLYLRDNIGFQLSFSATLGLILFLGFFKNLLDRKKALKKLNLSYLISITLAAQLMVFPLLLYHFSRFSLASFFSNLFIVPLLPFVMGLGFIFLAASLFSSFLGFLFSLPLYLLLSFLAFLINIFSKASFSYLSFSVSWWFPFLYYVALLALVAFLKKRRKIDIAFSGNI